MHGSCVQIIIENKLLIISGRDDLASPTLGKLEINILTYIAKLIIILDFTGEKSERDVKEEKWKRSWKRSISSSVQHLNNSPQM